MHGIKEKKKGKSIFLCREEICVVDLTDQRSRLGRDMHREMQKTGVFSLIQEEREKGQLMWCHMVACHWPLRLWPRGFVGRMNNTCLSR